MYIPQMVARNLEYIQLVYFLTVYVRGILTCAMHTQEIANLAIATYSGKTCQLQRKQLHRKQILINIIDNNTMCCLLFACLHLFTNPSQGILLSNTIQLIPANGILNGAVVPCPSLGKTKQGCSPMSTSHTSCLVTTFLNLLTTTLENKDTTHLCMQLAMQLWFQMVATSLHS